LKAGDILWKKKCSASKPVDQVYLWDKAGCNQVLPQTFGDGGRSAGKGHWLKNEVG